MRYDNIHIDAITANLPNNILTSLEVEEALGPLYERLNLSPGRLELFTGIKERRYWSNGTVPSDVSAEAGQMAMDKAGVLPHEIDCVIHSSVCRDFLEPATASVVHQTLGLPNHALNFDISNACLGMMSGITLVADMIKAGRIKRGLVVAGEIGYHLLKKTISTLINDEKLSRNDIKPHFASLTIGSAASAIIISHESVAKHDHKLLGGMDFSATQYNDLCRGSLDHGMTENAAPEMDTDAEELLLRGIEAAGFCWPKFLKELNLTENEIDKFCTHQVGIAHKKLLFKTLDINIGKDFATFDYLGNCGAASLPLTLALAIEQGHIKKGDKTGLLGIGSGINCLMLGVQW